MTCVAATEGSPVQRSCRGFQLSEVWDLANDAYQHLFGKRSLACERLIRLVLGPTGVEPALFCAP
jgi:hypothetical protein